MSPAPSAGHPLAASSSASKRASLCRGRGATRTIAAEQVAGCCRLVDIGAHQQPGCGNDGVVAAVIDDEAEGRKGGKPPARGEIAAAQPCIDDQLVHKRGCDARHDRAIGAVALRHDPGDFLAGIGAPQSAQQMQFVESVAQAFALGNDGNAAARMGQRPGFRWGGHGGADASRKRPASASVRQDDARPGGEQRGDPLLRSPWRRSRRLATGG